MDDSFHSLVCVGETLCLVQGKCSKVKKAHSRIDQVSPESVICVLRLCNECHKTIPKGAVNRSSDCFTTGQGSFRFRSHLVDNCLLFALT